MGEAPILPPAAAANGAAPAGPAHAGPFLLAEIATPLGAMGLVFTSDGLLWAAEFLDIPARFEQDLRRFGIGPLVRVAQPPEALAQAFRRYFAGELDVLLALPTGVVGSDLERRVWAELRRIPAGTTRSYGEMARLLGGGPRQPINPRAVGGANGRNPLAIVVPCHRVIGADGSLTGYAGGLQRKAWLLRHEGWEAPQKELF